MNKSKTGMYYGLVLIGGKSTRMRTDKANLKYHGKAQAVYCCELLKNFCEKVFVSCRKDQSLNEELKKYSTISDLPEFTDIGPLGGMLSAMTQFPNVPWIMLACDLPFVNEDALRILLKERNPKKIATAFISRYDQLPEPLCAIYESPAQSLLLRFLKKGINCPRKIMIGSHVELIPQLDKINLENVNKPEEYEKAILSFPRPPKADPSLAEKRESTGVSPRGNLIKTMDPRLRFRGDDTKTIHIQYYAALREKRGISTETISTQAQTPRDIYEELQHLHGFQLNTDMIKVVVNNAFTDWDTSLKDNDTIVFIPPVAGG